MCILNNNSISNIVSKIDANYKSFLFLDDFSKANIFDKLPPSEKYDLFKLQEEFREKNIKNYLNLNKYYDYIDNNNANKYLYVENDNIQIKWPENNGFGSDLKTLESLKCDKILVSRIEYDKDNEEFKPYKYILNKGIEKFVNRDKLGNCFSLYSSKVNGINLSMNNITELSNDSHIDMEYLKKFCTVWPSNEERAIPKKNENSNIICGELNLKLYKKFINSLSWNNINIINLKLKLLKFKLDKNSVLNYKKELDNAKKFHMINKMKTKYGYYGTAKNFGDLCGGAYQINTIFNFRTLCDLGIIKYIVFKYKSKDNYYIGKSNCLGVSYK